MNRRTFVGCVAASPLALFKRTTSEERHTAEKRSNKEMPVWVRVITIRHWRVAGSLQSCTADCGFGMICKKKYNLTDAIMEAIDRYPEASVVEVYGKEIGHQWFCIKRVQTKDAFGKVSNHISWRRTMYDGNHPLHGEEGVL